MTLLEEIDALLLLSIYRKTPVGVGVQFSKCKIKVSLVNFRRFDVKILLTIRLLFFSRSEFWVKILVFYTDLSKFKPSSGLFTGRKLLFCEEVIQNDQSLNNLLTYKANNLL